jgi:hypothetical protein
MAQASELDNNVSGIAERLAGLDSEFNTNKNFGFMGMVDGEEKKAPEEKEIPSPASKEDKSNPPEWFGPINTSLQTVRGEFQQGLGNLANEIQQLKVARQDTREMASDVPPEMQPVVQKFNAIDRNVNTLALRQEYQRAKDALRDARGKYKDFTYSDDELNTVWQSHVRNNPDTAASTNWDSYFKTQNIDRAYPKITSENEKLRSELERLKSNRNSVQDLYAVPRSNRQSTPTRSTSDDDFDEDLYQRAKRKIQKGSFRGFNRALVNEQRRMQLTA